MWTFFLIIFIICAPRAFGWMFEETSYPCIKKMSFGGKPYVGPTEDGKFVCYEPIGMTITYWHHEESPFMKLWHRIFRRKNAVV